MSRRELTHAAHARRSEEVEDQDDLDFLREVHVYPKFGPEHFKECWCHPGHKTNCFGIVVMHNVMH